MINDIWYKYKKWKFLVFLFWSLMFDDISMWCLVVEIYLSLEIMIYIDWYECVVIGRKKDLFLMNELYVCRKWWYYDFCFDFFCNFCFVIFWNNCKCRIWGYLYMFCCLNMEINCIFCDLLKKRKELLLKYDYYF